MEMTNLILRILLFVLLLSTGIGAHAAERFLLDFEFTAGKKTLERGKAIVTPKKHTWNKGLERSFLKLDCGLTKSGKMKKLYSTVDYFTGLRVTHQLAENNIEITVVRTKVQPRLTEIRALSEEECKDLAPIISTTTQTYIFPAKHGVDESHSFDEQATFRARLHSIGGTR